MESGKEKEVNQSKSDVSDEGIEYETVKLYYHIANMLTNRAKSKYKNRNHHAGQDTCLLFLDGKNGVEQNQLSDCLGIRPTSLSELLSKLEKRGLVTRTRSTKNRRTYVVCITPEGHKAALKSRQLIAEDGFFLTDALSGEDKKTFYHLLRDISQAIDREEK